MHVSFDYCVGALVVMVSCRRSQFVAVVVIVSMVVGVVDRRWCVV